MKDKVLFCRDDDGECSVWREDAMPVKDGDGKWDLYIDGIDYIIAEDNVETFDLLGKGFHGVRKGGKKLIEAELNN